MQGVSKTNLHSFEAAQNGGISVTRCPVTMEDASGKESRGNRTKATNVAAVEMEGRNMMSKLTAKNIQIMNKMISKVPKKGVW